MNQLVFLYKQFDISVEGGEGIKLNGRNIEKDQMRTDQEHGYSVDKNAMSCELQEVSDHKSCDNNYDDVPQSGQMDPVPPDPKDVGKKHHNISTDTFLNPSEKRIRCSNLDANTATNLDAATMQKPSLIDRNATAHTFEVTISYTIIIFVKFILLMMFKMHPKPFL